jgi:di/tricarboxylate transporter
VSEIAISFAVLAVVVVLFISNRVPVGIVALIAALSLWATGVLTLEQSLAGFGDPTVIFIAALFVVSEALDASGVTAWVGQQLIDRAGGGHVRLIVLVMLVVAGLTALISVNGAVAALLPVVVVMAIRTGRLPSELLLPLVFAAHAGSMLALTGTPVNVIVSNAAVDAGEPGFGFFEFALAGVPLLLGAMAVIVLLGPRLIPRRQPLALPADLSRHGQTLIEQYRLADKRATQDRSHVDVAAALLGPHSGLAEIMIPPRSPLVGTRVFPGMVSDSGDLVVLAVQRQGEDVATERTVLRVGDTLLLQGSWEQIQKHTQGPDVVIVDSPDQIRRQAVPLGPGAGRAIAVLAAMIVLLVTGIVPAVVAGLMAAGAMVLLRVLSMEGAYRGISWTTVILVAGMIPISTALIETGSAEVIADQLVNLVGALGPLALLAALFVVTAFFGQLISNMATALIVIPIAVVAATDLGISVRPILMSVTVAASAAYLTPIATPVNLMVMGPAGYRFGDYWKLGVPLLLVTFVVAVLLVPVIWPL